MKSKNIKVLGLVAVILAASVLFIASRSSTDDLRRELLLKVISFALNSGHYEPADLNDDFSVKAYQLYIDRIDYTKRFLLKEDVDLLS
ncbi:MAG: hypothetical protein K8R74_03465, partial [Bacteroidales bacterium]|nr:hypothetical protein [Bacteroidales bacterium]